ncbi:MAG: amidophosphoribosyltransferase [Clostridia bacterium]|nr:amidophosphoribosyltransferase [Clostridia bacterium]MBR5767858.1 amidophosphoribosyltransferase [Clostridia bacterium]
MGGFFGIASARECLPDVFFGTDYHSHLGTKSGGLAAFDPALGLQRKIHNIDNAPFRTKFEHIFSEMKGTSAIGCISDGDPQPLVIRSNLGTYAICMTGIINNAEELINNYLSFSGGHFGGMTGGHVNSTELLSAMINQKSSFTDGIRFAQKTIDGTAAILILKDDGTLIAARDRFGRLPVHIGKNADGFAVSFESFAYQKLGYEDERELGPGEIVEIDAKGVRTLAPAGNKKRICSFLWTYYGYPTSDYEGINVEEMRYRNGAKLAERDLETGAASDVDYVGGVPDSGTPHAIGYANRSGKPFARAFIKYTPTWSRSFMPDVQTDRDRIAKMKQIPVNALIKDKNLLFVDDSIVRGTQLRETVDFLYESGAKSVHIRSACPPIMYGCRFLNFSRATSDMELLARRVIVELEGEEGLKHIDEYSDGETERGKALRSAICEKMHFSSLEFQSLEGLIESIGANPCELCTYCWNGKD